jgi:hypothetical protein
VILVTAGKALVIALVAAVVAWLPFAIVNSLDGGLTFAFLPMALLGSFSVGLPIAALTFVFAGKHLANSPATLAMVTVLAGIMLVLASYALASEVGVLALGIPSFIAALTFGVLGWFWVLRPMRKRRL